MVGAEPAVQIDFDVGHPIVLFDPVVADAPPFRQTRQAAFVGDPAAEFLAGLGQGHPVAPLA